jgi:hypothetical protein
MQRRGWPLAHDARLRELAADAAKLSAAEIGSRLNAEFRSKYSKNAVIGRAKRIHCRLQVEPPTASRKHADRRLDAALIAASVVPVVTRSNDPLPRYNGHQKFLPDPKRKTLGGKLLLNASDADCRWVTGGDKLTLRVCAEPIAKGCGAYCAAHYRMVYVKTPAPEMPWLRPAFEY